VSAAARELFYSRHLAEQVLAIIILEINEKDLPDERRNSWQK
jgi:hypothetical protein